MVILIVILTGCAGTKVADFNRESVQSISVWTYDLENYTSTDNWFYQKKDTDVILDYLEKLKGKIVKDPVIDSDIKLAYGLNLMTTIDLNYLFIGDYMISNDGTYYEIDGEKAVEKLTEVLGDTRSFDGLYMMNHRYVSLIDDQWDTRYMMPTDIEVVTGGDIIWEPEFNVIGDRDQLETTIKNGSDKTLEYGTDYHFQVQIENEWYEIDTMTEMGTSLAWDSLLIMQEPGLVYDETIHLKYFQPLPQGNYRVVKNIRSGSQAFYIGFEFVVLRD